MNYSYGSTFEKELHQDIKNLIETGYNRPTDDTEFNDISLRLFRFQYENCKPYSRFCESKGLTPSNVDKWIDIPAIPAEALKYNDIACFPVEQAKRVFMTSGTTDPAKRGKSYRDDSNMELFDAAGNVVYQRYYAPDKRKLKALLISPPPEYMPESPSAYGIGLIVKYLTSEAVFILGESGFDMITFIDSLKQAEATGEPLPCIGATFGWIPFFDVCKEKGIKFQLPDGSEVIEGGGYKGKSREVSKEELLSLAYEILGVPNENVINLLGSTEITSVFTDNVLYNKFHGISEPRYKPNHPWTRTIVVDPDTLREPKPKRLPKGEKGVIRHYDLANKSTVLAIQTEDVGYEIGDGFEIMERGTGIAGCSLAIEEFIEASK